MLNVELEPACWYFYATVWGNICMELGTSCQEERSVLKTTFKS
jgi:hypothetical protein